MACEALTVIGTRGTLVLPRLTSEAPSSPQTQEVAQVLAWLTEERTFHLGLRARPDDDVHDFHESHGRREPHVPSLAWHIHTSRGMIAIDPSPNRDDLFTLPHAVARSIGDMLHFAGVEAVHVHTEFDTGSQGTEDSPSITSGTSEIRFTPNPENSSGPPYHIECDSDRLARVTTVAALITLAAAGSDGVSDVIFEGLTAGPQP